MQAQQQQDQHPKAKGAASGAAIGAVGGNTLPRVPSSALAIPPARREGLTGSSSTAKERSLITHLSFSCPVGGYATRLKNFRHLVATAYR